MLARLTGAALAVLCLTPAQARPSMPEFNGDRWAAREMPAEARVAAKSKRTHQRRQYRPRRYPAPGEVRPIAHVIGGRPAGCPHRFCGCALSLHLFGRIITSPNLNRAIVWLHAFPRASAAPGMVAVRNGHVFKLRAHIQGNDWEVWDANSGRGRIRIHKRSIRGYAIVNPHGRRA